MKKQLTLTMILSIVLCLALSAQWTTFDAGTGNTAQKMYVFNNDTAIIISTNSAMQRTSNGGETWNDITLGFMNPGKILYDIDFGTKDVGIVTSQDTVLLKTVDNGLTWTNLHHAVVLEDLWNKPHGTSYDINGRYSSIEFLDETTCFTNYYYTDQSGIKRHYLLRSPDAGLSWDTVTTDFANNTSIILNGIDFADDGLNGYAVGTKGTILKTADAGLHWEKMDVSGTALSGVSINDVNIISATEIILGSQAGVIHTTDAFANINILYDKYSFDFEILDNGVWFSAGTTLNVARSINDGSSWETANIGGGSMFDLAMFNGKLHALSTKGIIYIIDPDQLKDPIASFDASLTDNVLSITNNSENAGSYAWSIGSAEISGDLASYNLPELGTFDVSLTVSNAVGEVESEVQSFTVDSISAPWNSEIAGDQTFKRMEVLDESTAAIIGNKSTLFMTYDKGNSWSKVSLPDSLYGHVGNDLAFFDNVTGLATFSYSSSGNNYDGFMLKTSNSGLTWEPIPLANFSDESGDVISDIVLGTKIYFYPVTCVDENTAFVAIRWEDDSAVKHGDIFKTTDNGLSWEIVSDDLYSSFSSTLFDMAFTEDGQTAYLVGVKAIWKSTNAGESWSFIDATELGSVNKVEIYTADSLLLATQNGVAISNDGLTTWSFLTDFYAFDVLEIADSVLMAGKDEKTNELSVDAGKTWELNVLGLDNYNDLQIFNGYVYAMGFSGKIYRALIENFLPINASMDYYLDDLSCSFYNTSTEGDVFWDFGDGTTSEEENPTHTFSAYDTYNVSIEVKTRCKVAKAEYTLLVEDEVSVDDFFQSALKVYPNPSSGTFKLQVPEEYANEINIQVFSLDGKLVYRAKESNVGKEVELTLNIKDGVYQLVLFSDKGSRQVHKLVIN